MTEAQPTPTELTTSAQRLDLLLHGEVGLLDVLQQAPTPLLIMLGPEHRFAFLNWPFVRILRRVSVDSLLNRTVREAMPELDGQPFFSILDAVYRTGVAHHGREVMVILRNEETGEEEETYFNFVYQPLRNHRGEVHGIMAQATEVKAQVKARRLVEEAKNHMERQWTELQALYQNAPMALCLIDAETFTYVRANEYQRQITGLPWEEFLGKTVWDIAPQMANQLKELFDRVKSGEPVMNMTLKGELLGQPGVHRYWIVSYAPVWSTNGRVTHISCTAVEVTNQKRAENALIQAEKLAAVGRMAASIAHEINNPLESVTNLLYLAQITDDREQVRHYLQLAEQELRRVSIIANQTLRFHKQSSSPTLITAEALFSTVLSLFEGKLRKAGIEVERRFYETRPVRVFEGDIRQVLNNLVGNAIDAMPDGGRLLVHSHCLTDPKTGKMCLALTVADTGMGMSPEVQKHIFEPFFTTKGMHGTGLGLWISDEIVQRHNGRLRYRSSRSEQQHGTVATLLLPFD